jgi:Ion channel
MALPPLELFSLKKEAALLPGGFFHAQPDFFRVHVKPQSRPDLLLLISLLLVILLYPALDHGDLRRFILTVLTLVPVVLSTVRLSQTRSWLWPSVLLMGIALISGLAGTFFPNRILLTIKWGTLAAFCGFTVVGLFSYLRNARSVVREHLYTAVSIYLLLGMLWFALYCVIDLVSPGSFGRSGDVLANRQDELLYFSLVTLSTVGYGDVVALKPEARMVAALEGMAGVLYVAITVALLINSFRREDSSSSE